MLRIDTKKHFFFVCVWTLFEAYLSLQFYFCLDAPIKSDTNLMSRHMETIRLQTASIRVFVPAFPME